MNHIWIVNFILAQCGSDMSLRQDVKHKNVSQVCNRLVSSKAPANLPQVSHHSVPPGAGRGLPIKRSCQTAFCTQRWPPYWSLCPAGKNITNEPPRSVAMVLGSQCLMYPKCLKIAVRRLSSKFCHRSINIWTSKYCFCPLCLPQKLNNEYGITFWINFDFNFRSYCCMFVLLKQPD